MAITRTVAALWATGFAYTDIKVANLLWSGTEKALVSVVLGDLGSIVPLWDSDGSRPDGIFTFPPRRAVRHTLPASKEDGVTQPFESDMVWSLGTLLLTLLFGVQWTTANLTAEALRSVAAGEPDGLPGAFAATERVIRGYADALRASNCKMECRVADALGVALRAWEDKSGVVVTLASFYEAISGIK